MSYVDARQFSFLYVFSAAVIITLAVAALAAFIIYKAIAKTHTKEWFEAQKNRETKLKDVDYVAKEASLNSLEKIRLCTYAVAIRQKTSVTCIVPSKT